MMRGVEGKVGIIAGGGRGIGAATARRLRAEGACVVIGDIEGEWAASDDGVWVNGQVWHVNGGTQMRD